MKKYIATTALGLLLSSGYIATAEDDMMEKVGNYNEVTTSIMLKNNGENPEEWAEALTMVREWGKELAETMKEKTPGTALAVDVAGFDCYTTDDMMEKVGNHNEVDVSITLKNDSENSEEWAEALTMVKEWGKELAKTMEEKTPGVALGVDVAGLNCYKTTETE